MKKAKNFLIQIIAVCLALSLSVPVTVRAAGDNGVMPYASYYLDLYNTYICDVGGGKIEIWYEVLGTGYMDDIGVLSIELYKINSNGSLTWLKTFLPEDYPTMLTTNDNYHCSCVSYQGTAGTQYKAYVCIWAGKDGDGDSRYMWAKMV